ERERVRREKREREREKREREREKKEREDSNLLSTSFSKAEYSSSLVGTLCGSNTSTINGRPLPSMRTSMSSRPLLENLNSITAKQRVSFQNEGKDCAGAKERKEVNVL